MCKPAATAGLQPVVIYKFSLQLNNPIGASFFTCAISRGSVAVCNFPV